MTQQTASTRAAGPPVSEEAAPAPARPDDAIGGEVRIGRGAAPPLLRWFNYAVYLSAVAYLLIFWPATGYHPMVLVFAAALAGWLAFIFIKERPPEP